MTTPEGITDPFGVFGLHSSANDEEILSAYRRVCKEHGLSSSPEASDCQRKKYREVRKAWSILWRTRPRDVPARRQFVKVAREAEKRLSKLKAAAWRLTAFGLGCLAALAIVVWICIDPLEGHEATLLGLIMVICIFGLGWLIRCCVSDAPERWEKFKKARDARLEL